MFQEDTIYGIYGEAGSGKTILLQLILGFSMPNNGTISVDGKILHKDIPYIKDVGYSIGEMQLLPEYDCYENLKQLGMAKFSSQDINQSLDRVGLSSSVKVQDYTPEMKQKLKLAQALCPQPDLVLLDEPTVDLNIREKKRFWNIVNQEKERGAIVIITMREPDELRQHCGQVYELKNGFLNLDYSCSEKES